MEAKETINVEPKNGRVILNLYGKDIEVHESMFDENGVAILKCFGKIYEVIKPVKKKRTYTRKKKEEPIVEVAPIEESES